MERPDRGGRPGHGRAASGAPEAHSVCRCSCRTCRSRRRTSWRTCERTERGLCRPCSSPAERPPAFAELWRRRPGGPPRTLAGRAVTGCRASCGFCGLFGDLDDALHAQSRVAAPILGFHEANLDVDAWLGCDRLLLESFVRKRPGEACRWPSDSFPSAFSLPVSKSLTACLAAFRFLTGAAKSMCTRKPSFSKRTSSPSCSVLGPRNPNSIERIVASGAGNATGAFAALTTKVLRSFNSPSPAPTRSRYCPAWSSVCTSIFRPGSLRCRTQRTELVSVVKVFVRLLFG